MKLPTASSVRRAMRCPASQVLPGHDETTVHAERGSAAHMFVQLVGEGQTREQATADIDKRWRPFCDAIELEDIPHGAEFAHELALAYSLETGAARELARGKDRETSYLTLDRETEVGCIIDIAGIAPDHVAVWDLKFGYRDPPAAAVNEQLWTGALALARRYGRSRARVAIVRVRPDGSVWQDSAWLDGFDLIAFENRLQRMRRRVNALAMATDVPELPVHTGDHCQYCPAFESCPVKVSLIRKMCAGTALVEQDGPTTPETVSYALDNALVVKQLAQRVIDRCFGYAEHTPIERPNGKMLGMYESRGNELLDGDTTLRVVADKYGQAAGFALAKLSLVKATKINLAKVVSKYRAPDTKQATENRSIIDAIRDAGGSSHKLTRKVCEYDAPETPTT